jgi:hypothetical protein
MAGVVFRTTMAFPLVDEREAMPAHPHFGWAVFHSLNCWS